ncbi:MAG: hypothetical protein CMH83_17480 [Nocardioides sp.]|nr:hypothetical protein [Nocardioides sp.]
MVRGRLGILGRVALTTVLTAMVATLLVAGQAPARAGALGVDGWTPVDRSLDQTTCTLLGRHWAPGGGDPGCSRRGCLVDGAHIQGDYGTEACVLGRRAYADNLEPRVCRALGRVWLAPVNRCLQEAEHRSATVLPDAPQCAAPTTTYVLVPARVGPDFCVAPEEAERARVARDADVASEVDELVLRSAALCALRPDHNWRRNGTCTPLASGEDKDRTRRDVLVIGDSVTWRSADELHDARPAWRVDGVPGSSLGSYRARLRRHLRVHDRPRTLVLALGANQGIRTTRRSDYVAALAQVPDWTRVVLVTPYRDASVYGKRKGRLMKRIGIWMRTLAHDRPHTCLVRWYDAADAHPQWLLDGVHQTSTGEQAWAGLVERGVDRCTG